MCKCHRRNAVQNPLIYAQIKTFAFLDRKMCTKQFQSNPSIYLFILNQTNKKTKKKHKGLGSKYILYLINERLYQNTSTHDSTQNHDITEWNCWTSLPEGDVTVIKKKYIKKP